MSRIDETRPFIAVGIAVLTVSDTRTTADDKSGDTLANRITDAGHQLVARAIVKDDKLAILEQVRTWTLDPAIDVVITTGGTGFTGRDVTPEALEPFFEKRWTDFQKCSTGSRMTRSGHRPSSHAPQVALQMPPTFSCCRARRVPAKTRGTAS